MLSPLFFSQCPTNEYSIQDSNQLPYTGNIIEKNINKYTGNPYGDQFLVKKHKQYLLSREGKGSKEKTLIEIEDWLADPISLRARKIEYAIKRIHDEIYVREKLVVIALGALNCK